MNAHVAVKELFLSLNDDRIINDLKSEISILRRVNHPYIIRFYGICRNYNSIFFVTEECKSSLSDLLYSSKKPFDSTFYTKIAEQISEGCSFLHNLKIIHRDLKPGNILLDEYNDVKICDFGISKTLNDSLMTGMIGTPCYMSPELMKNGLTHYDEKVDVYSFGMILWEMFYLTVPFFNLNPFQISLRYSEGERPIIKNNCPKNLSLLIKKCWSQEPKDRPSFIEINLLIKENKLFSEGRIKDIRKYNN